MKKVKKIAIYIVAVIVLLFIGKDIPSGRYTATPVGKGSNFVVQDIDSTYPVNTILGCGGVPSYTFDCTDDQTIETEAPVKLTPVQ